MRVTPTTIAFCEALFRLQKRLTIEILQDENFTEEMEVFEIARREWYDLNEVHGCHGELAIISDPVAPGLRKLSLRLVQEESGTVYSITSTSCTAEDILLGLYRDIDPDEMVSGIKRMLEQIPGMIIK